MGSMKGDGFRDADWVWDCLRKAYEAETGATVGAMDMVFENDGTGWQAIRGSYEVGEFRGVAFEHDVDGTEPDAVIEVT